MTLNFCTGKGTETCKNLKKKVKEQVEKPKLQSPENAKGKGKKSPIPAEEKEHHPVHDGGKGNQKKQKVFHEKENIPPMEKKVFHPSDHPNFEEGMKGLQEFIKEFEQMRKKGKGKGKGKQPVTPYKRGSWRHQQANET